MRETEVADRHNPARMCLPRAEAFAASTMLAVGGDEGNSKLLFSALRN